MSGTTDTWFDTSYTNGAASGLITTIAAGSATAGHIWSCRFATSATDQRVRAVIQRLRVRSWTIAGFTAAQEFRLALFKLTAYTVAHSGGTGAAALTPVKKRESFSSALMTGRIAGTTEMTAGTHTISTDPIRSASFAELAAGAAVPKGSIEIFYSSEDLIQAPIDLGNNEGLLLRNEILMGAGGTVRFTVEMDWHETVAYP